METIEKKITEIKENSDNPRLIKDEKYKKLLKSIKDFPEMLQIRPIVVNKDLCVLGGNMRLKACKEAGLKKVPVIIVDFSKDQEGEFIVKDNVGFGEWDWDKLANNFESINLNSWGLDVWDETAEDVDYSILDDEDLSEQLTTMTKGVKKAIQIEFEAEHYNTAAELVKFFRDQKLYIGGFLIKKLKEEKEKL